jgi:hypothetical protein
LKADLKIIKTMGAKKAMRRAWCIYNLSEMEHSILIAVYKQESAFFLMMNGGKQFADDEKMERGGGGKGAQEGREADISMS